MQYLKSRIKRAIDQTQERVAPPFLKKAQLSKVLGKTAKG